MNIEPLVKFIKNYNHLPSDGNNHRAFNMIVDVHDHPMGAWAFVECYQDGMPISMETRVDGKKYGLQPIFDGFWKVEKTFEPTTDKWVWNFSNGEELVQVLEKEDGAPTFNDKNLDEWLSEPKNRIKASSYYVTEILNKVNLG